MQTVDSAGRRIHGYNVHTCWGLLSSNIALKGKPPEDGFGEPLGRYARMRRVFLKEHRSIYYNTLLLSEQLFLHPREVDEKANERKKCGVAEEVILNELVY